MSMPPPHAARACRRYMPMKRASGPVEMETGAVKNIPARVHSTAICSKVSKKQWSGCAYGCVRLESASEISSTQGLDVCLLTSNQSPSKNT